MRPTKTAYMQMSKMAITPEMPGSAMKSEMSKTDQRVLFPPVLRARVNHCWIPESVKKFS